MPNQVPQWKTFLFCANCYHKFDYSARRPVTLGCGHTVCKCCLSKLHTNLCPVDQTIISAYFDKLPENYAILQLVGGSKKNNSSSVIPLVPKEDVACYLEATECIEELALYLKSSLNSNGVLQNGPLSGSMKRKLTTLINCQLVEEEGRTRAMRTARSLGERSVTEFIMQYQSPQQLSATVWDAVKARGCQFLGPKMQDEILKLVLLALEDGSALCRKILIMFVLRHLVPQFPQASKTSIGHVVQLLYRASCFNVVKREDESSLLLLKEEFRTYEAIRKEHDTEIVEIATEAGLRVTPEQWSSLLYGDISHKSHMQSITDKLQTPQSFSQSIQALLLSLERTSDRGNLIALRPYLELLANIDPEISCPSWEDLKLAQEALKNVVKGLVKFIQNFGCQKLQEDKQNVIARYKTTMCRDLTQHGSCPRGANCTFAHSLEEIVKHNVKSKRNIGSRNSCSFVSNSNIDSISCSKTVASRSNSFPISNVSMSDSSAVCHAFDGISISETSSDTSTLILPSNSSNIPANDASSLPHCSSLPDSHLTLQTSHTSLVHLTRHQPISSVTDKLSPENHSSTFSTAIVTSAIKSKPNSYHIQHVHCLSNDCSFPSTSPHLPTVERSMKGSHSTHSISLKAAQEIKASTAAQPKTKLVPTQIAKTKQVNACNSQIIAPNMGTHPYMSSSEKDDNVTSLFSPWTSTSNLLYDTSLKNCNSTSYSSLNYLEPKEDSNIEWSSDESFYPSDKDEFIPFDPPLVSKYGHISRCPSGSVYRPISIQENSFSEMVGLTYPTSVLHNPLPSASLAPSFFTTTSPSSALKVTIVSQLPVVESTSAILPNALDCTLHPPKESDIIKVKDIISKSVIRGEDCITNNARELQIAEFIDSKNICAEMLEAELLDIEKMIQEREQGMPSENLRHMGNLCKPKYDCKT